MRLLVLATVTADGRPLGGPVDGYFLHGTFWFSSGRDIRAHAPPGGRPAVSATHLPGEDLAVTVHGRAERFELDDPAFGELRQAMLDEYLPKQGPSFEEWLDNAEAVGARIVPQKMFTFRLAELTADRCAAVTPDPLLGGRLEGGDPPHQPRLVVRRRVLVDDALGGGLVDPLHGQAQGLGAVLGAAARRPLTARLRSACAARPGPTCCAAGASRSGGSA